MTSAALFDDLDSDKEGCLDSVDKI